MGIFRGPGGTGDATTDAVADQVSVDSATASTKASKAAASATAAATSAASASTSASTASTQATNAANSASAASSSATAAAISRSNASSSETAAGVSASSAVSAKIAAEAAQTAAETAETNAETAETNAATSETNASNSASAASTSASNAATSASNASTSASNASTSASNAATSATSAQSALTSINAFYLGTATSNPTVDGNGDAVTAGDWYFNTSDNSTRIYTGSTWNTINPDLIGDSSPQLGGNLDLNSNDITGTGNLNITGNISLSGTVDGRDLQTDGNKLDLIEASADVTDATNVQAAGALMDSEVTNLSQVKAFDSSDYATAAQGSTADSALQNVVEDTTPQLGGDLDLNSNDLTGTGNINITGTLQTSSNATIGGNLTVSGTTTTVNTETINLADNNIVLNSNHTGNPTENAGITVERGNEADKVFQWNETTDLWETDDNFKVNGNITVTGTVDGRDLQTDGTKLDNIEALADVTDTANVTAAGALMDSEVTNLAQVKAFDSSDYATAAQGTTADSALQNVSEDTTPQLGGNLDVNGNSIVSASGGNISITPDGAGVVIIDGLSHPTADGTNGQVLTTNGAGVLSFATASGGISNVVEDTTPQLGGNLASNGNDVVFADNDKAIFGAGSDLQIYHDGSDSYIKENGTGALNIYGQGNINLKNSAGDETLAVFTTNSGVTLYHDNSAKIATTSTGIDVTGTAVTDGLTVAGNLDVDSGTIKLDGNFPTGTSNLAFGNNAGAAIASGAQHNVLIGNDAGDAISTGDYNTCVGSLAGTSYIGTTNSVAVGYSAGQNSVSNDQVLIGSKSGQTGPAFGAVGVGFETLMSSQSSAYRLVAVGYRAFRNNTTGDNNVGVGYQAGASHTTTSNNTYIGAYAGDGTGAGNGYNVAIGTYSMTGNLASGNGYNTCVGGRSGLAISSGSDNTLIGYNAGDAVSTGYDNTAVGYNALSAVNTENGNVAVGHSALSAAYSTIESTCVGNGAGSAITTGSKNTILGAYNGNEDGLDIRTLSNRIVLADGDGAVGMYIDNSQDAHFDGNVVAYSTTISDRRLKSNITNISNALDKVGQINGVTFVRNHNGEKAAGIVAQEIMEVLPEAVKSQALPLQTGKQNQEYYVVEYDAVTGLLVEAVKELKTRVEALESK